MMMMMMMMMMIMMFIYYNIAFSALRLRFVLPAGSSQPNITTGISSVAIF